MAPMTLRSLERGGAGVTIGAYLAVMQVLGIERDLDLLAKEDTLGRALQDSRLPARKKATARVPPVSMRSTGRKQVTRDVALPELEASSSATENLPGSVEDMNEWIEGSFASSRKLAELIDAVPSPGTKTR